MNPVTIFIIAFLLILNLFAWVLVPLFLNKNKVQDRGKSKEIKKLVLLIAQISLSLISIYALFKYSGIQLSVYLNKEFIKIGAGFSITGSLLLFFILSVGLMLMINRFLIRLVRHYKHTTDLPAGLVNSLRRWISFLIFIVWIGLFLRFSDLSLSVFSARLFTFKNVPITLGKIIQALFIGYTVYVGLLVIEYFYSERIQKKGIDTGKGHTIFQILKYFIWVLTIVIILSSFGLSVTVLLAGSAALFVGLGFGLQTLFNDFVSGLIILFEGSIRVNDVVELENGIVGKVKEIGLRTSKVLTRDNIINIIPNNNFVGKNVINWSYSEQRTRFKVDVGVAYGSDVRLVEKILIDCARQHDKIHTFPSPFVYFTDFGDSSLNFSLYFWMDDAFWVEKIRSDLRFEINDKFKEFKIEIPFPQRDLHIRSGLK